MLGKGSKAWKEGEVEIQGRLTTAMAYLTESSVTRTSLQSCSKLGPGWPYLFSRCTDCSPDVGHRLKGEILGQMALLHEATMKGLTAGRLPANSNASS